MNFNPIADLSNGYVDSLLSNATQSTGLTSGLTASSTAASATTQASDTSQLSPFAQLLSTLQQLQQSNPTEYQRVTKTIATNLQTAAQTAQSDGNSSAATQLNQLAIDFTTASSSSQLPNVQDLAQATGSGNHHHHGHQGENIDRNGDSSSTGVDTQNQSLNPLSIILSTLSDAGIETGNQ